MDAKEILWNYFTSTGEIGSYLLIKGIEQAEDLNTINTGAETTGERISVERSDNSAESGL